MIAENILADGPREEDWWEKDSSDDSGSEDSVSLRRNGGRQ
jgi:hypothetical protein